MLGGLRGKGVNIFPRIFERVGQCFVPLFLNYSDVPSVVTCSINSSVETHHFQEKGERTTLLSQDPFSFTHSG